jgi:hypothetical protein
MPALVRRNTHHSDLLKTLCLNTQQVYLKTMKKPQGEASAGWYDAPEENGFEQFWNGKYWTNQKRQAGSLTEFKQKNNFLFAISNGFSKILDYRGTAKRFEFWYFLLFSYISMFFIGVLTGVSSQLQPLGNLYALCLIPCIISCEVRRMHDVGKSGWFILIPVYNLYLLAKPSITKDLL